MTKSGRTFTPQFSGTANGQRRHHEQDPDRTSARPEKVIGKIEETVQRSAQLDASRITVEVVMVAG
jgi:hypothetical protein